MIFDFLFSFIPALIFLMAYSYIHYNKIKLKDKIEDLIVFICAVGIMTLDEFISYPHQISKENIKKSKEESRRKKEKDKKHQKALEKDRALCKQLGLLNK